MPIRTRVYEKGAQLHGMTTILESGICTDDQGTRNEVSYFETGRVELQPIPRTAGLVAKALDGQTIRTTVLDTDYGRLRNMMQMGSTRLRVAAPRQPVGLDVGRQYLAFQRVWVQLAE